MTKFACKNCCYRFNAEAPALTRPCPYCGENTVILEQTAEELIREVN